MMTTEPGGDSEGARSRRLALYALSRPAARTDDYVLRALEALRPHADRIVVLAPQRDGDAVPEALRAIVDDVVASGHPEFTPAVYATAVDGVDGVDGDSYDEFLLTGDTWFGPICDLAPVLSRMADRDWSAWAMIENDHGPSEEFADAGFPALVEPWAWTVVKRDVVASSAWSGYWADRHSVADPDEERRFLRHLRETGHQVAFAFAAADYSTRDPGLYTPGLLIEDGCPVLLRGVFTKYPPFLDRFAVIGREILRAVERSGYPVGLVLQNLARTVPPKSLYAIGGMLEVIPDVDVSYDPEKPLRIAVVVHVGDMHPIPEILDRLAGLPVGYDLYLTTTDGRRGAELQRHVEGRADARIRFFDVRVTPASRGRDMSDFFVGCRDVLLGGRYDLIVKVHSRRMRRKTVNVRRYFRRYQYENLLNGPGYIANLLGLFQREPGLGLVFPPMVHIGYSTMGRAWAGMEEDAAKLSSRLGIHVPLDRVSPLAPFGGMFIARPEALAVLTHHRWRYGDYSRRNPERYDSLSHLQERMLTYAAGERGYHSRTVLTSEHASISHTALESKVDHLFSTTRGWPVEQIQLLQKAGFTGHGGVVALSRMYVRLNHPRAARVLVPLYDVALRSFVTFRLARNGAKGLIAALLGRPWEADS